MFRNCYALESIDVSSFKTTKVSNMQNMFQNCYTLQSLDLSGFTISKSNLMTYMFSGCSALRTLNLTNWDISSIPSSYYSTMFDVYSTVRITCSEETKTLLIANTNLVSANFN